MPDFKELISTISDSINAFNKQIPGIEGKVLDEMLLLIKKLDLRGGRIAISGKNLKLLAQINGKIKKVILSKEYIASVKEYAKTFGQIIKLQNQYFSELESKFKPPALAAEIQRQAVESVVSNLTDSGLETNIGNRIKDMLRLAVTSGSDYNKSVNQFREFLTSAGDTPGYLTKYAGQITTDAINQFSGTYTQIISNDLGFEWFRFSGSNIETTRIQCLACSERKWFHISEMPEVLKGNFAEFKALNGKINSKTGLPEGMIEGTDVTNFQVYANGHRCMHKYRPVNELMVPAAIVARVKATQAYILWERANGKVAA